MVMTRRRKRERSARGLSTKPLFSTSTPSGARSPHERLTVSLGLASANNGLEREAQAMAMRHVEGADLEQSTPRSVRRRAPASGSGEAEVSPQLQGQIDGLRRSGGKALPGAVRRDMESCFGSSFAHVRVHAGAKASTVNDALGSSAFTLGDHVFFGRSQFDLSSRVGRGLLAHELTHTIQQGDGGQVIQRAMKFELQTLNEVWRTKGKNNKPEKLPRKFGPHSYLHKVARKSDASRRAQGKEGSGMELQSETGGFLEFETPKWFRKWSSLKERIEAAVAMTKAMDLATPTTDGRKEFPFDTDHLNLKKGEKLEIKIVDPTWLARIQSSESIDIQQYESLLNEHERASIARDTVATADAILQVGMTNRGTTKRVPDFARLRSLLQIIVNYIISGGTYDLSGHPAKAGFRLMSRTNFHSIYKEILDKDERALFREIVHDDVILSEMGLDRNSMVFSAGGGFGTDTSKNPPAPYPGPTVYDWLVSIHSGRTRNNKKQAKDLLSHPSHGSHAMGRFDVETKAGKKDTGHVKFEVRGTDARGGSDKGRDEWVDYAESIFETAAVNRWRNDDTALKDD